MGDTSLDVSGVSKRFGGLQALSDVGIRIERGQVYGLIGPNGAGKTTFFNVLTGLYTPDSGTFELAGKPYKPTAVHEVAKAGIARTFSSAVMSANRRMFWNVRAIPALATSCTAVGLYGLPASSKLPLSGVYRPVNTLKKVVFPAPFGPIRP